MHKTNPQINNAKEPLISSFNSGHTLKSMSRSRDVDPADQDVVMRRFIRHPSDIPIDFDVIEDQHCSQSSLVNIGRGGLCFNSKKALAIGATVHIEIAIDQPPFKINGTVAWVRADGDQYTVGVTFDDKTATFSVRMVEQVCYIEHYRSVVKDVEGRELSSEEAAVEWVQKYAAHFPSH